MFRSTRRAALFAVITSACLNANAQVHVIELQASQDTSIYQEWPDNGNGSGPAVHVGQTNRIGAFARRGLFQFDVAAALPAGATIQSAMLNLVVDNVSTSTGFSMTLHRLLASWGEGTANTSSGTGDAAGANDATWERRFHNADTGPLWAAPGGDFVSLASASRTVGGTGAYSWGSTAGLVADVQMWLDLPSQNFGWILRGNETVSGSAKRFVSSEGASLANRPVLEITYTSPVPEADRAVLMLAGLGVIAWKLRRRTKRMGADIRATRIQAAQ